MSPQGECYRQGEQPEKCGAESGCPGGAEAQQRYMQGVQGRQAHWQKLQHGI